MIHSFQAIDGFMTGLPLMTGGRIIKFNDKLNVIFGNSGTGKSCMGKALAAHCGIEAGGWSRISDPARLATNSQGQFPVAYKAYVPGFCNVKVEWDGIPSFYNDADIVGKNDNTWFFSNQAMSKDGITSEAEMMDIMATKPSAGQFRIHKINKIMKIIQNPPRLDFVPPDIVDKVSAIHEINYIQSLPRKGKPTLILDEPEKGLSLPRQKELFAVLVQLSEHFQVIAITHYPFIVFEKKANIIDAEENYSKICKKLIKEIVK